MTKSRAAAGAFVWCRGGAFREKHIENVKIFVYIMI